MEDYILILISILVISVIIGLIIRKYLMFITQVSSISMLPTLKPNDKIVTFRIHNTESLRRGDLVVFYSKEKQMVMIKRLIGLPGEQVKVLKNGDVLINQNKLKEPYVKYKGGCFGTFNIPNNEYFLLGDNRLGSNDGREWQKPTVLAEDLIGVKRFGR